MLKKPYLCRWKGGAASIAKPIDTLCPSLQPLTMKNNKILYISQEITPYLAETLWRRSASNSLWYARTWL